MIAHNYTAGFTAGRREVHRLADAQLPIIPAYLAAQADVAEMRHLPIMSDRLIAAHRRSRAYSIGYLRGFRDNTR